MTVNSWLKKNSRRKMALHAKSGVWPSMTNRPLAPLPIAQQELVYSPQKGQTFRVKSDFTCKAVTRRCSKVVKLGEHRHFYLLSSSRLILVLGTVNRLLHGFGSKLTLRR